MDPDQKRELKRQAFIRLAAQRRRAGLLRGRVVVISLLCFVVLWGIVFAQMATGNDPVLSAKRRTVATSTGSATRREAVKARAREAERAAAARAESRRAAEAEGELEGEAAAELEREEAERAEDEEAELRQAEAQAEEEAFVEEPLVTSQS